MHRLTILCLTFIAGFVDTATFVSAKGLFAAHVTGNFVLFGAALANGFHTEDYVKLMTFPVFIVAVAMGAVIYSTSKKISIIFWLQALLLISVGSIVQFAPNAAPIALLGLTLVMAMGLQNALHRYLPGPMTTVMTGTVMNWSAGFVERIFGLATLPSKTTAAKPMTGRMMLCFATGCIGAGFISQQLGLACVSIPGIILALLAIFEMRNHKRETV